VLNYNAFFVIYRVCEDDIRSLRDASRLVDKGGDKAIVISLVSTAIFAV
jgi:hypothetical protein